MNCADVVIDTNVLVHAGNPGEQRQADAITFLEALLGAETLAVVDPGFEYDESSNRSKIGAEYIKHVGPSTFAFQVLVALASTLRIKEVSDKVPQPTKKWIERNVANVRDRTFLRVALNSEEKILVSHDHQDFPSEFRSAIAGRCGIQILTAGEMVQGGA